MRRPPPQNPTQPNNKKMQNGSPPLLPSKLLRSYHLDPMATIGLDQKIIEREVLPMLSLGRKLSWLSEDESQKLEGSLLKGDYKAIFDKTALWHERLNPANEAHSNALAGWMLIQNLRTIERKKKLYKKPYSGLKTTNGFHLKKAILEAIKIQSIENKKDDELYRHFLALIICQKMITSNFLWGPKGQNNKEGSYSELKRSLLGQEVNKGNNQDHQWYLSPVYGFLRNGKWLSPPIEHIKRATKEIWISLSQDDKAFLKSIELKIL
jgi:hypothetical protein